MTYFTYIFISVLTYNCPGFPLKTSDSDTTKMSYSILTMTYIKIECTRTYNAQDGGWYRVEMPTPNKNSIFGIMVVLNIDGIYT